MKIKILETNLNVLNIFLKNDTTYYIPGTQIIHYRSDKF